MYVDRATADTVDVDELALVAAQAFPLACPPSATPENITAFVRTNLSAARFVEYLTDPQRAILTANHNGRIVGYVMLIFGVADDPDIQRAVPLRPAAEVSKIYVLSDFHGTGAATALIDAALDVTAAWGVECVWLGVNQENVRAQRFYAKNGFKVAGTRTFQLGSGVENDYVMVRDRPQSEPGAGTSP
ncbi:N-acetyltransferase [Mycobacterium sp. 1423905.2]|uniref:GNAT family N-acetyltransferase n=1 Tax=Mycobacterium sp. 1423905.2 TaxID=1856859 RepID=UPI0008001363|nr:GNAT family N-acetyltransferase [Mycobacterium sp. 1423905.2]OBJ53775.1 acetyltransferase [Mycobacterium sp. 1423905.2]